MHKCPHPTCTVMCQFHILACKAHWFKLPKALRDEINATWRSGDTTPYLAARQRAVDFWKANP